MMQFHLHRRLATASTFLALFISLAASSLRGQDALPDAFRGQSLAGWTTLDGGPVTRGWEASSGEIRLNRRAGQGGGHIVTAATFGDFDLSFEWKIAARGNSGLKYRVRKYGQQTLGLEYQICDDPEGRPVGRKSAGALYDLYEPAAERLLKPAGEWNAARIIVRGDRIEHWLNGALVVAATVGDDQWRQRIAESKFADKEQFGQSQSGQFMLTDHGSDVAYRNFDFRPLTTVAADPRFAVDVSVDVMVPMRDGVHLATDVYRPSNDGQPLADRRPIVLIRTPYGKGNGQSNEGKFFASHGYVVVVQDTRGRYRSEGVWHWMTDDGFDGFDCAAWIEKQPWSNGQIGMLGTSYVGGTQHALAMSGSPHLKTVIPVDAVSNMGRQSMRNAGAFEMRFWNWIMLNAAKGSSAARDEATAAVLAEMVKHRHDYLKLLPLRRGTTPLKLAPEYENWLIEAMRHGANNEFWDQNNIVDHPERYSDIPVYLVGGWYDSWAGNTTANYLALSQRLKSDVYLIMGPWIHGAQGSFAHGQVTFGQDAAIADPLGWRLTWFDHYLKGERNEVGTAAPFKSKVRIFVMGTGDGHKDEKGRLYHGGYWRDEPDWPPRRAVPMKHYLVANGKLTPALPEITGGETASTLFTFDPENPVPTIGGNISSGNDIMLQGAWDQRGGPHVWNWQKPIPLSARNDVVVFQSEPLPENVEVTGEIEVKLWISSTAVDTDFTAKLLDVYPPSSDFPGGFDLNIADGIARARFRDSLKEAKLMEPGHIYPITVKLYPTSNVFKRGHRIRVDISSSNFPRFDVNPNTGERLAENRRQETCVNTIHHDRHHPSHIVLPIMPSRPPE